MARLTVSQMANRDFLSRNYSKRMGKKSRAATLHEVPHEEALKLYERGLTDLNIADMLGLSKGDVYKWRTANGLISNMIRSPDRATRSRRTKTHTKPPEK